MHISTYAVDFEAHYSKKLSVRIQGVVNYSRATHIFLLAIYGPDVEYVGPVENAHGRRYLDIIGSATTQGLIRQCLDQR